MSEGIGYDTPTAALAAMADAAQLENINAARKIFAATALARLVETEDAERLPPEFADYIGAGATSDIMMTLGVSQAAAMHFVNIGEALNTRLPCTKATFTAGLLDYTRVRVIADVLDYTIDTAIITAIEPAVVEAGRYKGAQALRSEIMRLLIATAPDEAARLRKRKVKNNRHVRFTPETHGTARLLASLTATEAADAAHRIEELCTTVCDEDPRNVADLRVDALMGLLNGQRQLQCLCDRDSDDDPCPFAHYTAPEHTATVVHVHIDPETLLALLDNPANLTGYGPIDPELARILATDATWQTIIARARRAATGQPTPRNEPEDLPAGYVPPPVEPKRPDHGPLRFPPTPMTSAGKLITRTLAQVRFGAILAGIDGHGGHTEPPPGALTYGP